MGKSPLELLSALGAEVEVKVESWLIERSGAGGVSQKVVRVRVM
jgi:hypothetical protein